MQCAVEVMQWAEGVMKSAVEMMLYVTSRATVALYPGPPFNLACGGPGSQNCHVTSFWVCPWRHLHST